MKSFKFRQKGHRALPLFAAALLIIAGTQNLCFAQDFTARLILPKKQNVKGLSFGEQNLEVQKGEIQGEKSVIGGLTALFHYNLIEQIPRQVWVLVPPTQITHTRLYRLIRTKTKLDRGVIIEKGYRIVSVERAVLEGLKMAKKIGERTAVQAARNALATRQTTEGKLGRAAKELGFDSVLTRYFEVITT